MEIINSCTDALEKETISDLDIYLFHEGKNYYSYKFMGAHYVVKNGITGVRFTTWAPNASSIYVIGDFSNFECCEKYKMTRINKMGLWSTFIPKLSLDINYKYSITSKWESKSVNKADPYAIRSELRPNTASIVTKFEDYIWKDREWIDKRNKTNIYEIPINIYEVHLGSWKTKNGEYLTYKELAEELPEYLYEMGYTHIELMPLIEHPLDASWGYQAVGYYSATSRYGLLEDLKKLVDALHQKGIGVILDWVPGHFCRDEHGLYNFDGGPTYEYEEGWKSNNKGWGTSNFDLGKPEVKSFLISNALFWLREFHIDGLRVDAVSNMIYLNYGREEGEWTPNVHGGTGCLEGIQFIKDLNIAVFSEYPKVLMIAEESTSWPNICKPIENGGLGFNFKWNMGWMNDTLEYIKLDPINRKYDHNRLNFSMMYNYSENFVLPISHDEVVHGKKSLLGKMWGDYWNKFAGLRCYAAYMMGHPGKKLLFMGSEFGQFIEWREYESLEWKLIEQFDTHKKTQDYFKSLNHFYKENKALWELDYDMEGFSWIDADNRDQSIITFMRKGRKKEDTLVFICNFTPQVYYDFRIGVPYKADYKEIFNSDRLEYGGSNQVMDETLVAENYAYNNQRYSVKIKIPPMATLVLNITKFNEDKITKDNLKNENLIIEEVKIKTIK